jgi:hypothetical protein
VLDAPRGAQANERGRDGRQRRRALFLHADTALPRGALPAIIRAADAPGFVYGGFHHRFSGADWRLSMISALHNFRCRKALTFYGDQALFVSRAAFVQVGGFPLQPIEDIALSQRLKQFAPPAFHSPGWGRSCVWAVPSSRPPLDGLASSPKRDSWRRKENGRPLPEHADGADLVTLALWEGRELQPKYCD